MIERLRKMIRVAFGYHASGEVKFPDAEVDGTRVKLTIELGEGGTIIILRLTPETAWLVGNKLIDAGHDASKNRAGDTPS